MSTKMPNMNNTKVFLMNVTWSQVQPSGAIPWPAQSSIVLQGAPGTGHCAKNAATECAKKTMAMPITAAGNFMLILYRVMVWCWSCGGRY